MSAIDLFADENQAEREILLGVAARSILQGLDTGHALEPDPNAYPESLQAVRASFVTLRVKGLLRGCIGSLDARRPLVSDVALNAFAAAFRDPRFPALRRDELSRLTLHLSVLSPPQALTCTSEEDLIAQLRPGIDGLILEDRGRRGTFLPSVWEQLPDPKPFLEQLRQKAGLPSGHWSETLRIARYTTDSFSQPFVEVDRPESPDESALDSHHETLPGERLKAVPVPPPAPAAVLTPTAQRKKEFTP